MSVTISQDEAEQLARDIRIEASERLAKGSLFAFTRGQFAGQLTIIDVYLKPRPWVFQGIRNEVNYLFSRAHEEGQS